MSIAKKVAGQSAWFLVGNVYTLIVGFTFQIYLARQIGAEGLGLFGLLQTGVGIFSSLLGLGIAQVMLRFIPEHVAKREYAELYALVWSGSLLIAVSSLFGVIVVLCAMPWMLQYWPLLVGQKSVVMAGILMLPLSLILYVTNEALRGFCDIRYIVIGGSFLQLTIKVISSVVVFSLGYMVVGYVWAVVFSLLVALIWMQVGLWHHLGQYPSPHRVSLHLLPAWKSYAKLMYGNSLIGFLAAPLQRFLVVSVGGVAAVGVLMVASTLYQLPGMFHRMFLSIVAPMVAAANSTGNRAEVYKVYHLATDWVVRLATPLIIFLFVYAQPVLALFGQQFSDDGAILLMLLVFTQFLNLIAGPIGNVLNMCGQERKLFVISVVSIVLNALLLLALVPHWGLPGVGIVILVVTLFSNLSALVVAWRSIGLWWWSKRYTHWILPSIVTTVLSLVVRHFLPTSPYVLAVCLGVMYVGFHGVFILVHGFNEDDREVVRAILKKLPLRVAWLERVILKL